MFVKLKQKEIQTDIRIGAYICDMFTNINWWFFIALVSVIIFYHCSLKIRKIKHREHKHSPDSAATHTLVLYIAKQDLTKMNRSHTTMIDPPLFFPWFHTHGLALWQAKNSHSYWVHYKNLTFSIAVFFLLTFEILSLHDRRGTFTVLAQNKSHPCKTYL